MNKPEKLFLFNKSLNFPQKLFLISVSLSIGLGKWGAWIGFPKIGVFIIDLFFISSLILFRLGRQSRRRHPLSFTLILSFFILLQFLRSEDFPISLRIRDLIPFIYLLFIPLIIDLLRSIKLNNVISAIRIGVLVCISWTFPLLLGLIQPLQAPEEFFGVPIFTHRYDLTGIILAIGIIAFMEYSEFNLVSSQIIIFVCLCLGIAQSSRAATIAVLLAFTYQIQKTSKSIKIRYLLFVPVVAIFSYSVISIYPGNVSSIVATSSLARFGFLSEDSEASVGATNTYLARVRASDKMLAWFTDQDQHLFGVGPGAEMVQQSGAVADLSGSLEVRAPHNWFIGLWVRYGLIGTLLWCLSVFGNFFKTNIRVATEWKFLILIICLVSAMGVIIESPFGSLPLAVMVAMTYVHGIKNEYK